MPTFIPEKSSYFQFSPQGLDGYCVYKCDSKEDEISTEMREYNIFREQVNFTKIQIGPYILITLYGYYHTDIYFENNYLASFGLGNYFYFGKEPLAQIIPINNSDNSYKWELQIRQSPHLISRYSLPDLNPVGLDQSLTNDLSNFYKFAAIPDSPEVANYLKVLDLNRTYSKSGKYMAVWSRLYSHVDFYKDENGIMQLIYTRRVTSYRNHGISPQFIFGTLKDGSDAFIMYTDMFTYSLYHAKDGTHLTDHKSHPEIPYYIKNVDDRYIVINGWMWGMYDCDTIIYDFNQFFQDKKPINLITRTVMIPTNHPSIYVMPPLHEGLLYKSSSPVDIVKLENGKYSIRGGNTTIVPDIASLNRDPYRQHIRPPFIKMIRDIADNMDNILSILQKHVKPIKIDNQSKYTIDDILNLICTDSVQLTDLSFSLFFRIFKKYTDVECDSVDHDQFRQELERVHYGFKYKIQKSDDLIKGCYLKDTSNLIIIDHCIIQFELYLPYMKISPDAIPGNSNQIYYNAVEKGNLILVDDRSRFPKIEIQIVDYPNIYN